MKPIEKDITLKETGQKVSFHIINDNFIINPYKKIIQGAVNSFVDGNIANSFDNGQIKAIKISDFQMIYEDIIKFEEEVEGYIIKNIDFIVI